MGVYQKEKWKVQKLGEIASIKSGGTPSRAKKEFWNGEIPWVKISDIDDEYINKTDEFITEDGLKNSSANIFPKGTILFTIFATIGKVGILNIDATTNQAIAGITPNESQVNSKFLTYSLRELAISLENQGKGVAQKNINLTILKSTEIPLPPLPEQERIVAKLDTLFAHLEQTKKRLEQIPVLLKQFRQAVLTQAVTGKLTEEWREGKELDWEKRILDELCHSITDGDHQAPPQVKTGIPFLVISNVNKGIIDFESVTRFVPIEYYNSLKENRRPKIGDVLYTVTGSYGIPILVNTSKDFCFQRHIAILRPNKSFIEPKFLKITLQSDLILSQAHNVATGTAQLTVPLRGIKSFTMDLPSLIEQTEIVRRVESLFAKADAIEARYKVLKELVDQLPQAILGKAFRGEV